MICVIYIDDIILAGYNAQDLEKRYLNSWYCRV